MLRALCDLVGALALWAIIGFTFLMVWFSSLRSLDRLGIALALAFTLVLGSLLSVFTWAYGWRINRWPRASD